MGLSNQSPNWISRFYLLKFKKNGVICHCFVCGDRIRRLCCVLQRMRSLNWSREINSIYHHPQPGLEAEAIPIQEISD
ncbi:hypothetical protein [Coleofasciculus sp. FACHB-1120]|uniref:hypothetical protein n=1 Tax=Coleofasciculus sp. FACHB-1120 TaxID=2692783 RepID=UPI001687647F|nr:hypothetical protein [Coleofasciculus sp. FACHB-1120]MBD2741440.1 hypothetical protein [Coleofasciculus sp. FACHB-1120]